MTQMSMFWQECEVSKPNKRVPVPKALLDDLFKLTTNTNQKIIEKEAMFLDLTSLLSTAESTATSHRSSEANYFGFEDEYLLEEGDEEENRDRDGLRQGKCRYCCVALKVDEVAVAFAAAKLQAWYF
jgi:hypothetical protein